MKGQGNKYINYHFSPLCQFLTVPHGWYIYTKESKYFTKKLFVQKITFYNAHHMAGSMLGTLQTLFNLSFLNNLMM